MINPTFKDTITIYHQHRYLDEENKRNVTEWIRTVHKNCYFGTHSAESLNGNVLSLANSYIARIPYNGAHFNIAAGDIVIKGEVMDIISDTQGSRTSDLLNKHKPDSFTVRAVVDNSKIPQAAHYKLAGV